MDQSQNIANSLTRNELLDLLWLGLLVECPLLGLQCPISDSGVTLSPRFHGVQTG
jgi:hypothetical protein